MRSYNNLYEPMLQDDYIKQRFINASKKKKNRNAGESDAGEGANI